MEESVSSLVTVALAPGVPSELADALEGLGWATVVRRASGSAIVTSSSALSIAATRVVGLAELPALIAAAGREVTVVLVKGVLDDEQAARLEDASIGYVDAAGQAWLPGRDRSLRSHVAPKRTRGLRAESLLLAQLLADHPRERWSERSLALRGAATQPTAHRLLRRLEGEGLVERKSVRSRRVVSDVSGLRRWLAEHGRPSSARMLPCFIPEPGAAGSDSLEGVALALTGSAGAEAIGLPVMTTLPMLPYRVDVREADLEGVPALLGGFRTDEGPNTLLIHDPRLLAFRDASRDQRGRLIAPPSRIMLDLYLEQRGASAADVFLDLWGDEELR